MYIALMPTKRKGRPKAATTKELISVRISKDAYKYIAQEAKRDKRTFIATLDYMLGV